jgi:cystathionine beta-synthase
MYKNVAELVGNTPLIEVNRSIEGTSARIMAKVEYFNPGLSVKDRIAINIIQKAEQEGKILPGATIIESTSGNTGVGLAIMAAVRGYRCICVMNTNHSPEKIRLLKAYGADVEICDGSLKRDHPQSSYSVSKQLAREIPNSFLVDQYTNQLNPLTHYEFTGKEIWEQTKGKVTHLIASASTGGTISGAARYLKEKNPNIQVWASDAYGSAFKHFHETGEYDPGVTHSYLAENVGKKFIPDTIDFSVIDHVEKVSDKAAAQMARRLAKREGLLLGYSCGAAMAVADQLKAKLGPEDLAVVICPDHGSRYMNTIYSDEWMEEKGFINEKELVNSSNGSI